MSTETIRGCIGERMGMGRLPLNRGERDEARDLARPTLGYQGDEVCKCETKPLLQVGCQIEELIKANARLSEVVSSLFSRLGTVIREDDDKPPCTMATVPQPLLVPLAATIRTEVWNAINATIRIENLLGRLEV